MAGNIYLVDFENMGNKWADALEGISEGDTAYLFYSDNSPKAMLEQLEKVERMGAVLKFRRCESGHNGLDFQLASELGYLIARNAGDAYYILSCDSGFDVLGPYWQSAGASVSRIGLGQTSYRVPEDGDGVDSDAVPDGPKPERMSNRDLRHVVPAWLDAPMTQMGLSKYERAHSLGCARACMLECVDPGERMEKFKCDTIRIKGRELWMRLETGLGPALSGLFQSDQ